MPPPAGERDASEPFGLASLPFDLYQRHKLVQEAVERLREGRPRLSILDLGGAPGHLKRFLPRDHVIVVDQEGEVDLHADGHRLPFADRAFDVVVTIDTLEHLPPRRRTSFLREIGRVTGDALLLTAPFDEPRVAEAESILAAFLERRLHLQHRFLDEHRRHGLPVRSDTEKALTRHVGRVVAVPNGNLDRWLLMMAVSFYLDADPSLADLKRQVSAYYNRAYYRTDNTEPAYRWLLAARRDPGAPLDPQGLVPADGARVQLDFSPMATLMEITGVDLLKEAYGSILTLQGRLGDKDVHAAGLKAERDHRQRVIENLQGEIQRRQERIEELREKLDEKDEALEDRGRRIVEIHQEIERLRHDQGNVVALRDELERERRGAGELRDQTRDLTSILRNHVDGMEGIRAELSRFASLGESLQERDRRLRDAEGTVSRLQAEQGRTADLSADLRRLSATLAARGNRISTLERRVEELSAEIARRGARITALQEHAGALRAATDRGKEEVERSRAVVRARDERIEKLTRHAQNLERVAQERVADATNLRAALGARDRRAAEREEQIAELHERTVRLRRQVNLLRGVVETRQQTLAEIDAQAYRFRHERDRLQTALSEANARIASAQTEIDSRGRTVDELRNTVAAQLRAASGLREQVDVARRLAAERDDALAAEVIRSERSEAECERLRRAIEAGRAKLTDLAGHAMALEAKGAEEARRVEQLRASLAETRTILEETRSDLERARETQRELAIATAEATDHLDRLRRSPGHRLLRRLGLVRDFE